MWKVRVMGGCVRMLMSGSEKGEVMVSEGGM